MAKIPLWMNFISGLLLIALSFLILIKPIKKPETPIISEMTAFLAQEALPEPICDQWIQAKQHSQCAAKLYSI